METTTLKNLISENNPYGISGITIPRIQRAYAQGRYDAHAVKTRERFLSAIHAGLINNGLTLDFIYGNIQNGQLIPLDGQQRLTTLWLLHWYADKKEGINDKRLARFSYNTRYSARDFLIKLVNYEPTWKTHLSDEIKMRDGFQWNGATILRLEECSQCLMKSKSVLPILMTYGTNWIKLISISAILRR